MSAVVIRRWFLGAAATLAPLAAAAADLAPTDALLSPNVLVYFSVTDCADFQAQYRDSSFGEMVNDPAMADLRTELIKKFEEASAEAEKEIGMPLSDLLTIPTGEAAFAVLAPPGEKLGLMLFLDVGDHQEQLDKLLDKAEEQMEKDGKLTRSSSEFEGTEITVWTNEEAGPREPFNALSYVVKDSMLVAATNVKLIQDALVRWDGKHDRTFAGNPTYKYIIDRCDLAGADQSDATFFIDPLGLFKAGMAAAGPEVGMQGAMVMGFLPVLGLDKLKGVGSVSAFAAGDYELLSQAVIYVDQPVTGVLRALVCPPTEQAPPEFIAEEASNVSGIHWDVPGAYAAIEQVYDFFTSPGSFSNMIDGAAKHPMGPGLHPKHDFIDHLSGQIYMTQEMKFADGQPQQDLCILLGLKNEAKVQEAVTKVTQMDGVDLSVREFEGAKIYEAENPPAGQNVSPAFAVAKGYLMFSMNVEKLEDFLRDGGSPLAKSANYLQIAEQFPDAVSYFTFQRQDQTMEFVYEAVKQGLSNQDDFDINLLPDFEALRKYFGVAGGYAVPDEKGVFIESFSAPRE